MALIPDSHLLLIDGQVCARRSAVLREAVQELRREGVAISEEIQSLRSMASSDAIKALEQYGPHERSIVLVVVSESQLSGLTGGKSLPRIVCESVQCGYDLVSHIGPQNDIYLLTRDLTGVDVTSMLLSGIRGVLDIDALGSCAVLAELIDETRCLDKHKLRLLVGRPYSVFNSLLDVVRDSWQLPPQHWELLLALAEIPVMRLVSDEKPKQKRVAQEIARYSAVTGFSVTNENLVGGRLPLLLTQLQPIDDDEEIGADDDRPERSRQLSSKEMLELPYLPLYARMCGFPARLLPIRNSDPDLLASRLYKGMRDIHIVKSTRSREGFIIGRATMPSWLKP